MKLENLENFNWGNFNWGKSKEVIVSTGKRIPVFSINKNGYVRVNKALREHYSLDNMKAVKIRYSEDKNNRVMVGFMFLDKKEDNSFSVYDDKDTKALSFPIKSLFNAVGIKLEKTEKYKPEVQKVGDKTIFVIEIKK